MRAFDIDHKRKCPKCGKEMDYLYGKLLCSSCGYQVAFRTNARDESVQPDWTQGSFVESKIKNQEAVDKTISESRIKRRDSADKPMRENMEKRNIYEWLPFALIIGLLLLMIPAFIINNFSGVEPDVMYEDTVVWQEDDGEVFGDSGNRGYEDIIYEDETVQEEVGFESGETYISADGQSDGMVKVIEKIYQKDYDKVTADDYYRIKYISIDWDYESEEYLITYSFTPRLYRDWDEYFEIRLKDTDFNNTNFSVFSDIDTISMIDGSISSLKNLPKLTTLKTGMPLTELKEYIDPLQLKSLTLFNFAEAKTIQGIEEYKNLNALYIYANTLENIDELSELKQIKNLGIYWGDNIKSFEVLKSMTTLEMLSISSYVLEKLDFLTDMHNLYSLVIYDAFDIPASEWVYITQAKSLRYLTIDNCIIPCDSEMFFNMSNLEELSIKKCGTGLDIETLTENKKLDYLNLEGTYIFPIVNGSVDFSKDSVLISEYITEIKKNYPNLDELEY